MFYFELAKYSAEEIEQVIIQHSSVNQVFVLPQKTKNLVSACPLVDTMNPLLKVRLKI